MLQPKDVFFTSRTETHIEHKTGFPSRIEIGIGITIAIKSTSQKIKEILIREINDSYRL